GAVVTDIVSLLTTHGADLEAEDNDGLRPLHVAAKAGEPRVVLCLLTAGASLYVSTPQHGWNTLHFAARGDNEDTTRLLSYWDADVGQLRRRRNNAGITPPGLAITESTRAAMTTLWEFAALGQVSGVLRACQESASHPKVGLGVPWAWPDVNDKTSGLGFTPLHACMSGLAARVKGLDVTLPCHPPLPRGGLQNEIRLSVNPQRLGSARWQTPRSLFSRMCCSNGKKRELLKVGLRGTSSLAENTSMDQQRSQGSQRGLLADNKAQDRVLGYLVVCRTLVSRGAIVDSLDSRCRTPLMLAAAAGVEEIINMLLDAGADPNQSDADGNTPAHFAMAYANVAAAAVLEGAGGNLDASNLSGCTPRDVAGARALVAPASTLR
ncbi:unnamed protein product, partial [Choristocarpus tenellus]